MLKMMNERFRVEWTETNYNAYDFACENCPEEHPKITDFTTKYTGTVYDIIKGVFLTSDKFLVCLDETHKFVEVPIEKCKRIY